MLTVYRASAGAGKTHKLTGEYLTLLFTGPGAFRRILAVTFTNKATDEMKTRIVDELYNLASGRKSDYVELLKSAYSLTEIQVRKQAAQILIDILHDYSAFNISTTAFSSKLCVPLHARSVCRAATGSKWIRNWCSRRQSIICCRISKSLKARTC